MAVEIGYELALKQTQKLVMTPKLQQALRLLQMPLMQLEQVVRQELESNPVLELAEENEPEEGDAELGASGDGGTEVKSEETSPVDEVDWASLLEDDGEAAAWEPEPESEDQWEPSLASKRDLADHLREQLHLSSLTPEEVRIGEYLIGCLDADGFLRSVTVEEIARELGVSPEQVERVRAVMRQFDPVGVASVDLREALLAQLEAAGEQDTLAYRIVDAHLDDLMHKRFSKLAAALGVAPEEVERAAQRIAQLDPLVGARYSVDDVRFVIPDLVVEEVDGEFVVSLNDSFLPRLRISNTYQSMLASSDPQAREYIAQRLNSARWLLRTIDQRRRTMLKVMRYIVEAQREFFQKGEHYLKPLTLQEVADGVGLHESTISRVTSGKYVQTPWGIFELKYFFGGGVRNSEGEEVSVKSVKRLIREIVEGEDPRAPFSDSEIASKLEAMGYHVARRTVTKYREQLGILPARLRQQTGQGPRRDRKEDSHAGHHHGETL